MLLIGGLVHKPSMRSSWTLLCAEERAPLVRQMDIDLLLDMYDSNPSYQLHTLAQELNASTNIVRYWLHHHGRELSRGQRVAATVDRAIISQLPQRPSLMALAEANSMSLSGVRNRLRALLPEAEYQRFRLRPGRPPQYTSPVPLADSLPKSKWGLQEAAEAAGVSSSTLARKLTTERLRHLVLARGARNCVYKEKDFLLALRHVAGVATGSREGPLSFQEYTRARRKILEVKGLNAGNPPSKGQGRTSASRSVRKPEDTVSLNSCDDVAVPIDENEYHDEMPLPAGHTFVQVFGSWNAACNAAGLKTTVSRNQRQKYDRTVLIAAIAGYIAYAEAEHSQATIRGYSDWAKGNSDRPSASTIRSRLLRRDQSWAQLVSGVRAAAIAASSELTAWLSDDK